MLEEELLDVMRMEAMTVSMNAAYMSKVSRADHHAKSRKRGRTDAERE